MQHHDTMKAGTGHASHGVAGHHHEVHPIDSSYRIFIRTALWLIAFLVFLGFAIWWAMT